MNYAEELTQLLFTSEIVSYFMTPFFVFIVLLVCFVKCDFFLLFLFILLWQFLRCNLYWYLIVKDLSSFSERHWGLTQQKGLKVLLFVFKMTMAPHLNTLQTCMLFRIVPFLFLSVLYNLLCVDFISLSQHWQSAFLSDFVLFS